jgi:hypothetical protein
MMKHDACLTSRAKMRESESRILNHALRQQKSQACLELAMQALDSVRAARLLNQARSDDESGGDAVA